MKIIEENREIKIFVNNEDELDNFLDEIIEQEGKDAIKFIILCENSTKGYNTIIDIERKYYD